jgi:hypothetical protein
LNTRGVHGLARLHTTKNLAHFEKIQWLVMWLVILILLQ